MSRSSYSTQASQQSMISSNLSDKNNNNYKEDLFRIKSLDNLDIYDQNQPSTKMFSSNFTNGADEDQIQQLDRQKVKQCLNQKQKKRKQYKIIKLKQQLDQLSDSELFESGYQSDISDSFINQQSCSYTKNEFSNSQQDLLNFRRKSKRRVTFNEDVKQYKVTNWKKYNKSDENIASDFQEVIQRVEDKEACKCSIF